MSTPHSDGLTKHGPAMNLAEIWFVAPSMGINIVGFHVITIAYSFLCGVGVAISVSVESWLTKIGRKARIWKPAGF